MEEILEITKEKINQNNIFRKELAKKNLLWFARIYFNKYLSYQTAPFQFKIYEILEDDVSSFNEIIAFRGSAKTTVSMLFYPIWAIVTGRKHFLVLISDTFGQIKEHIYNIKSELENNQRLIEDFGPFDIEKETQKKQEWQMTSMIIPSYDAKVVGKSAGQKVRGIRYKQWRPDLIIVDDIEDLEMVRTKEQRDKTHRWLTGNVIPDGKVVEFPLLDKNGDILWKGKYPDMKAIEKEKRQVIGGSPIGIRAWQREYLLKLVPEEGQEVKDEWIKRYDTIPDEIEFQGTGVDLAISKSDSANYTAMVSGKLAMVDDELKIYIMPNPVNERLSQAETVKKAKEVSLALGDDSLTPLWVENVAYQKAAIEMMEREGLPAEGIQATGDKRARLRTITSYIQNGTVLFPKKGCEDLIIQLLGFGVEAHDDLVDAFVYCVKALVDFKAREPRLTVF